MHQGKDKDEHLNKVNESLGKSYLQKSIDEAESQEKLHKIASLANLKGKPVSIINTAQAGKEDLTASDSELSGISIEFLKHFGAKVKVSNTANPTLAQGKKGDTTQVEQAALAGLDFI